MKITLSLLWLTIRIDVARSAKERSRRLRSTDTATTLGSRLGPSLGRDIGLDRTGGD
jgi:hypothetical protein